MTKRIHNDFYLEPYWRTVVCPCGKRYEIWIDEDEPEECPHGDPDQLRDEMMDKREMRNEDDFRLSDQ